MELTYVTGNDFKIELARKILEPLCIKVLQKKIDCPEIQDNEIMNVSKYSAKYVSNKLNLSIIKNDSGLEIDALKGFPGPYTSYIEDTINEDGILKLLQDVENRKACFVEVISYCEPKLEPVSFISKTYGTIAKKKRGDFGWSFDKIFVPDSQEKTLAEYGDDERWKFWSQDAYLQLKDYLKNKNLIKL